MTFNTIYNDKPAAERNESLLKSQFDSLQIAAPSSSTLARNYKRLASEVRDSRNQENLREFSALFAQALNQMPAAEAKLELQKYVGSPLLRFLLKTESEESTTLLKELAKKLFEHGLLLEAVSKTSIGDQAPSKKVYSVIKLAIYEQLKQRTSPIDTAESIEIPYQQGGLPPTQSRLHKIVAACARRIIEDTLGYRKRFFSEQDASREPRAQSQATAIRQARDLLKAKLVLELHSSKANLTIEIPKSICTIEGAKVWIQLQTADRIKQRVHLTDTFCLHLTLIAQKCHVHLPKVACSYIYGTTPQSSGMQEIAKVRMSDVCTRAQACVLDLLGVWAASQETFKQVVFSHAGDKAKEMTAMLQKLEFLSRFSDKLLQELEDHSDSCSDVPLCMNLTTIITDYQKIQAVEVTDICLLRAFRASSVLCTATLLKGCPTLTAYLRLLPEPPHILSESFRLLDLIPHGLIQAEKLLFKPSLLFDYLQKIKLLPAVEPEYVSAMRLPVLMQELQQTLCNVKTKVKEVITVGTYPLLSQLTSLAEHGVVAMLQTIFIDASRTRALEIEIIRYRDDLLWQLRIKGSEYRSARPQEVEEKKAKFIEALVEILPIYPSKFIRLHQMEGMDDTIQSELAKRKALSSPIPELMQEFVLHHWSIVS